MNAAETIQAAIDKLEGLRDDSQAWDWRRHQRQGEYGQSIGSWENLHGYYDNPDELVNTKTVAQSILPEDAELIVTLHRTIDTQLAILRAHLDHLTNPEYDHEEDEDFERDYPDIMGLAYAILGEVT